MKSAFFKRHGYKLRRLIGKSGSTRSALLWSDPNPVRSDLFGIERLEQHALTLAAEQAVTSVPEDVYGLHARLEDNAQALRRVFRENGLAAAEGLTMAPAAEWLLDNVHVVEAQIRDIRSDLPIGYYKLLPKLKSGPFAGYPRVFGLAWAFVAHTDSHFDCKTLVRFLTAYQTVQPLTIGELWAVSITLRIVLIENLRRLSDQMARGRMERKAADDLADRILAPGQVHQVLLSVPTGPLSELFAARLAERLRNVDPMTNPAVGWLEERLAAQEMSIADVVRHAQDRLGASNVSVRNVITAFRDLSTTDWNDIFEEVSFVEARLRRHPGHAAMDFASRNLYRSAVEEIARGSGVDEIEVAERAIARAQDAPSDTRASDPGWHLIGGGRHLMERDVGFRTPAGSRLRALILSSGLTGYLGLIAIVWFSLLLASAWLVGSEGGIAWLWLVAMAVPTSALAVTLVDIMVLRRVGATLLPGLDLRAGVPSHLRTMVIVPVIMTDAAELARHIETLEIHYLSSGGGDLTFALLIDGADADTQVLRTDAALLEQADEGIAQLNRRYPSGPAGPRFLHLHRRRLLNPAEGVWMGWERKRGKLEELNRLLRGATDTSFVLKSAVVPNDVRYVITLDADTRMPRDVVARMVGKMGHPLNRPSIEDGLVVAGYGILQPRVTPAIGPISTPYLRTTAGSGGMDPYASAASDVFQDLFGQGSFTGKGIYDVDAVQAAMHGRIAPNTVLSHDLLEGIFARAGLASDIELVEAFPERHDLAASRQHRWTRGDWQLAGRIMDRATPMLGRIKIADTLRRSLLAPATLVALSLGWFMSPAQAAVATALLLTTIAVPVLLPAVLGMAPSGPAPDRRSHLRQVRRDGLFALRRVALDLAFLPDTAWRTGDAIWRANWRLHVSRRLLLEWTTAARNQLGPKPSIAGLTRRMAGGLALTVALCLVVVIAAPASSLLVLPFTLFWLAAPVISAVNGRDSLHTTAPLSQQQRDDLRLVARRTWRYFETFVTADHSHLPPDNHQETPVPLTAPRTSPTNIGLYLLSCVSARDFGWIGLPDTVERLERTLASIASLEKLNGHLFNWYDTRDGTVLLPRYVSTVDSGNLAGHLIALAQACSEWAGQGPTQDDRRGLMDSLDLVRLAWGESAADEDRFVQIAEAITAPGDGPDWAGILHLSRKTADGLANGLDREEAGYWLGTLAHRAEAAMANPLEGLAPRLHALAEQARTMALAMDFAFLLDPERKLLSIGFSADDRSLDRSCYDLLASEARLASLFAIAKNDVPPNHWFRLGRTSVVLPDGPVLGSWSGSMFEYLMPILVMDEPDGSLLAQSNLQSVRAQQRYAAGRNLPWGVSESGFNARDLAMNYQYSSFGVPELGLKRGLAADQVIAPYATGLAAMVDPHGAWSNFQALSALGAMGPYGFYEALDFTPVRQPAGQDFAVVRSHMAHHQGMTILSIANVLHDGRMRHRFHSEPMIKATELLLQERLPRNLQATTPLSELDNLRPALASTDMQRLAMIDGMPLGPMQTHLLSNGRYSVMLTAQGGGFSKWGSLAITRWHADPARDTGGTRLWMRDLNTERLTEIGGPLGQRRVEFFEDRALISHQDGKLASTIEVLVSGEDAAEVRMLTLTSTARLPIMLELTSYAELVLATPATDAAHPAFARMFVQTEYLPEYGALIATRRPRSPDEPRIWTAHVVVAEADQLMAMQYETDRAAFLGRDNDLAHAAALSRPLNGTSGTVLDPVFALRHCISIAPGATARLAYWTLVADTREALVDLIDRHHDRNAVDRARTLAWTQAQVQLRHLGINTADAGVFQALTGPILVPDARFRIPGTMIAQSAGKQSVLWSQGVSGDLPIVVMRISEETDMAAVHEILLAQEYWRMKGLAVDVVILNEHPASYVQGLQLAIEAALRGNRPRIDGRADPGGQTFALRRDLLPPDVTALLLSTARVVLSARMGSLAEQVDTMRTAPAARPVPITPIAKSPVPSTDAATGLAETLEFWNGTGGFARDGREYVTILEPGRATPAPWINVIANDAFGFHVSATGAGCIWAENSRENRLTAWSNDAVTDPATEAFLIRDDDSGEVFSPTARPLAGSGRHVARHGFGYSRFQHHAGGLALDLLQFVPLDDPVRISRLELRNLGPTVRHLSVITYAEPVMGLSRDASAPFLVTEEDAETGALFARNPWNVAFPDRVMFADLLGRQTGMTTDRAGFLGPAGDLRRPSAAQRGAHLSGRTGAGLDPCLALEYRITLAPGEMTDVTQLIGQTASPEAARDLIARMRKSDPTDLLAEIEAYWRTITDTVQVETPDRAMDIMVNGWLPYQTLACRIKARAAFYQASGAYGFRDQLQDGMAMTLAQPDHVRSHLLRAAGRQFPQGDVQHWWLPHSGQGVRTLISDDVVWLAHAVADYVATTGDVEVLDQGLPFLDGPALTPGQHDAFFLPDTAVQRATLWEHAALGLDLAIARTGRLGLPLMGTGDWNDGMNRVGEAGQGESVWLGWLLLDALNRFADLAHSRDPAAALRWRDHARTLRQTVEREAWDGAWYRRATFDDGSWLGSSSSPACRIDSIAQSWAVLSGQADPLRAAQAMASLDQHLVRPDPGLALLFTPPFDGAETGQDPGYIAGYPPGLRENGGQYSHAAMWAVLAHARMGDGTAAARLMGMVNPINHALTPETARRYRVEPYVIAADVYSVAPHEGRGGWSWYTGSAGWMSRAAVEGILGLRRRGQYLVITPRLPESWPGYRAKMIVDGTDIRITVRRADTTAIERQCSCDFVMLDGLSHDIKLLYHESGGPN